MAQGSLASTSEFATTAYTKGLPRYLLDKLTHLIDSGDICEEVDQMMAKVACFESNLQAAKKAQDPSAIHYKAERHIRGQYNNKNNNNRRTSQQNRSNSNSYNSNNKGNWCPSHRTSSHDASECYSRNNKQQNYIPFDNNNSYNGQYNRNNNNNQKQWPTQTTYKFNNQQRQYQNQKNNNSTATKQKDFNSAQVISNDTKIQEDNAASTYLIAQEDKERYDTEDYGNAQADAATISPTSWNNVDINFNKIDVIHDPFDDQPIKVTKFLIPIEINGMQTFAKLDSSAECNLIHRKIAERLNLPLKETSGFIRNFTGHKVKRTIVSVPIKIKTQHQEDSIFFDIFDGPNKPYIYLGEELIEKYSFEALVQCYKFPNDMKEKDIVSCEVPKYTTLDEENNVPTKEDITIMDFIEEALEANKAINPKDFCPLPETVLKLPLNPPQQTFFVSQYPLAEHHKRQLREVIDEWYRDGVIEYAPPNCPFNTPVFAVPKKDAEGNYTLCRPCHDFRRLNSYLPDDRYPIPLIQEIFEKLQGAQIFSTIDLKSCYNRFPVHEPDRIKTAFTFENRQYIFRGCPFSIKTIPALCQRVIQVVLYNIDYAASFFDDIVVFSKKASEHPYHVKEVIERLTNARLIINILKSHFAQESILLLGFRISAKGITADTKKLINVDTWPIPTTTKQLQHYLGFFNYFRAHIPNASSLTHELDNIRLEANLPKVWNDKHTAAFDRLKQALLNQLPLAYPNFNEPFHVATDASKYGIGAVLYQLDPINKKPKYISFNAKSLSKPQRNYSTIRRETLGVIFALSTYRRYLISNRFTLHTDHMALTFIHNQRRLPPVLASWYETLSEFSFTVIHCPGVLNILPDHLSRFFVESTVPLRKALEGEDVAVNSLSINKKKQKEKFIEPNNEDKENILLTTHLAGHQGARRMVDKLHDEGVHWTNMEREASDIVSRCEKCLRHNIVREGYHPLLPIIANQPLDHVAIDLAGPLPISKNQKTFIMVLVDVLTRYCVLTALPDKRMDTICEALVSIFCNYGFPKIIQSDNGTEFVNKFLKYLTTKAKIDHRLTTPYHPRANGLAERAIKETKRLLRKLVEEDKENWDAYLDTVQYHLNARVHPIHKTKPFVAMFARQSNPFKDYSNSIANHDQNTIANAIKLTQEIIHPAIAETFNQNQKKAKNKFDRTHKITIFEENQWVKLRNPKYTDALSNKYTGPFCINTAHGNKAFTIHDINGHVLPGKFAPKDLIPISTPRSNQTEQEYEIDRIIAHKVLKDGTIKYRVRWTGYLPKDDTWETTSQFNNDYLIKACYERSTNNP